MTRILHIAVVSALALVGGLPAPMADGQTHSTHGQPAAAPAASSRVTMEALHAAGGTPPGWRFAVPPGDAAAGRQAFVAFKCYACHAVKGEQFPLKPGEVASAGPELSGMGSHHPPEYLAESIMNPSAVLIEGPGYIGGDGRSIMPAYPDMTVGQLANLVAYLRSLTEPDAHAHESPREQTVGGYRVRLVYKQPQAADHHHMHHGSAPAAPVKPRLLVFLTDSATGQPIPYVPMSARIEAPRTAAQTVKLAPAWGPDGFHYGANLRLPEATNRITLSIGVATMQLGTGAPEGLKRPRSVAFGWK